MIKTVDEVYATEMKTYWNKGNKKNAKEYKGRIQVHIALVSDTSPYSRVVYVIGC